MLSVLLLASTPAVSGWVVPWNPASIASLEQNAPAVRIAMVEWAYVQADGTLGFREVSPELKARLRAVRKAGVRVYGMSNNYAEGGFDPERMTLLLSTPERRREHAEALARFVRAEGLDGLDLDYESLKGDDRDRFSELVEAVAARLRRDGKRLSVTVTAKLSEPGNWDGVRANDWPRLGRAADEFRVMTYDQHWATSEPGPIAADEWVERVARFALSVMPKEKVWLGVAAYGYDWTKKPATSLTWGDFPQEGWTVDPASGERMTGDKRFAGPESLARKLAIAQKLKLAGVAVWYIGSEAPGFWDALTRS